MARLHVIAEGQSEETFIKQVLAPHLWNFDIWTDVTLVTTSRKKRKKGGVTTYGKLRNDLNRRIRQHRGSDDRFTTMLDLYALPEDFPGREAVRQIPEYRYRKRSAGPLITMEVGLPKLREKYPHFNRWIDALEGIGKAG